jgi:hypothetical protein
MEREGAAAARRAGKAAKTMPCWGATLDVEGLNGAKFTLLGVM